MQWMRNALVSLYQQTPRTIRKIFAAIIGGTILLLGIALLVLPGPAFIVIPIGLLVLASEFAWAGHVLRRGKDFVDKIRRGRFRRMFTVSSDK